MARCRRCGAPLSAMRPEEARVCGACGRRIRDEADRRLGAVTDALLRADDAPTSRATLEHLDRAEGHLRRLLDFEQQDLTPIHPSPSGLLSVIARKRHEVFKAPLERGRPSSRIQGPTGVDGGLSALWFGAAPGREERRRGVREPVRFFVSVEPGSLRGTTKDLSPGGVQVHVPAFHRPGSPVLLVLDTDRGPVRAEGIVRWVGGLGAADRAGTFVGLGVQFDETPEGLLRWLRRSNLVRPTEALRV